MRQRRPAAASLVEEDEIHVTVLPPQCNDNNNNDSTNNEHPKFSISTWMKLAKQSLSPSVHQLNVLVKFTSFLWMLVLLVWIVKAMYLHFSHPSPNFRYPHDYHHQFHPLQQSSDLYHVLDCPEIPPPNYPREYPILDVLQNWNVRDVTNVPDHIYQGVCVFDYQAFLEKHGNQNPSDTISTVVLFQKFKQMIDTYRAAEVPFVVRNDPAVLEAVRLWSDVNYLAHKLRDKMFQATLSNTTIMTYYSLNADYNEIPPDFVPPTTATVPMSFSEWYQRATTTTTTTTNNNNNNNNNNKQEEHAYLRLDACLSDKHCDSTYRGDVRLNNADFIYDDLSFFRPSTTTTTSSTGNDHTNPVNHQLYDIDGNQSRGINCRFGTPGLIAESHFDNERNYIAMVRGDRRFLLSHPRNCPTLYLYPQKHPLERHTRIDWANVFTKNTTTASDYPNFDKSTINEVVLQAGDVLYLPTYWFHHIVSLTMNYQCNTRSGYSIEHDQTIYDCGFFYDFPG